MFSPSLLAMMHQSLSGDQPGSEEDFYQDDHGLAAAMRTMLSNFQGEPPEIPVAGFSTRDVNQGYNWFPAIASDEFEDLRFYWGRISVRQLTLYLSEFRRLTPEIEYFDLGTSLRDCGSGSSFDVSCAALLAQSAQNVKAVAAIVDRGKIRAGQSPDDYRGKLRHAVTKDLILADHAEQVLSVLLERLQLHGALAETEVSCALVPEPAHPIGRACFRHANAVEMLDALKALRKLIDADPVPVAINISLGTHVGPHNGDSPLEEYIARIGNLKKHRFVHAAAGNDGLSGKAALKYVDTNEREFFRASVPGGCTDLLIEFWWHDPMASNVKLEVTVQDGSGQRTFTNLWIDCTSAGRTLRTAPQGYGQAVAKSLFHARCRNQMSCIAFALGAATAQALPALNLLFAVDSPQDIVMHAWVVVSEGASAMFVEGGSAATVMVPATARTAVSVAGIDSGGQPWAQSSRGPAIVYQTTPPLKDPPPWMAHRADLGSLGLCGTSFASPRACADTVDVIRNGQRLRSCGTVIDLLRESYSITSLNPWSSRIGYTAVKQ